jgi:hypothetical protein
LAEAEIFLRMGSHDSVCCHLSTQAVVVFDSGGSEDHSAGSGDTTRFTRNLWRIVLTVLTEFADLTIPQSLLSLCRTEGGIPPAGTLSPTPRIGERK